MEFRIHQHLIFLVDPDTSFGAAVAEECGKHGYPVRCYTAADDVVRLAEAERPAVFLLNAQECAFYELNLCDAIRQNCKFSRTPIIVLSASESGDECIQFLNKGADDYLPKTISPRELALRVRAVIKRAEQFAKHLIQIGSLEIDAAGMIAWVNGKPITLTATEFRILEYLARNMGRPVSREELLRRISLKATAAGLRRIDSLICRLREKVEPSPSHPIYIQTILKVGYCLPTPQPDRN